MKELDTPVFRSRVEDFQLRHEAKVVTMLFSDVIGSTRLKATLGEKEGIRALLQHHEVFRKTLAAIPEAEEIGTAGDSFFLVFSKPSDAVKFALLAQNNVRQLSAETGHHVLDRIGIHVGEVWIDRTETASRAKDLYGLQVDLCARVSSLGGGDQILLTRFAFDSARQVLTGEDVENLAPISWLDHGPYVMKGFEEALEVCEVGETGKAALTRPADTEKARRFVPPGSEPVLGWRPAVDQPVPGTSWVLERKLGEGGFGEVWLGRDKILKTRHVFKFCFRADRVRSLKREVTLFRLFKERVGAHPNIVGVEATYFDEPPFYIVMQYVDGSDLRAWCEAQGGIEKVPLAVRLEIVAQVALALQAAHESGVVHRDVKPANILVSGSGTPPGELRVKLTDFGIGQVVSDELLADVTRIGFTQTLTSTSSQSGTQMYMAPELFAGKAASTRSDIYSLGVVLYQLLVRDFSRPIATDWGRDVTDASLREVLMRCFAGNPAERFEAADQLAKSVRTLDLQRPRNVDWKRVSAMLFGYGGTSIACVGGLAFAVSGYSATWIIPTAMLTGLVGINYLLICRHIPDGGGAYSAARSHGRFAAACGGLFLIADFVVMAAFGALAAFQYIDQFFHLPHLELFAGGALVVIGALNFLGPKRTGGLALIISAPAALLVLMLCLLCLPHATSAALHNMQPPRGGLSGAWHGLAGTALALTGVHAIANLTGVMKLDAGSTMDNPRVGMGSAKAVWLATILTVIATTVLGIGILALRGFVITADANVNAPGAPGVRDHMLSYMAQVFVGESFGSAAGAIAAAIVSISVGLLLLSSANTAIVAMVNLTFVMARDGEMPKGFTKLNRFGVPLIPLSIAAALPLLLVLYAKDMAGLAGLCGIGAAGAIMTTTGACLFNKVLSIKWGHRLLLGLTTGILACVFVTLAMDKPKSLLFFVLFILLGLLLSNNRKKGWA